MLQARMFDGLSFDPFALLDDGAGPGQVGIGGRHVAQSLVVATVVVLLDERLDLAFEITRQEVVFQHDAVFHGLMPALGLGMEGRTAQMLHLVGFDVFGQIAGDVAGAIVGQQAWFMLNAGLVAARCRQRQVRRVCDVLGAHGEPQLPGDCIALYNSAIV